MSASYCNSVQSVQSSRQQPTYDNLPNFGSLPITCASMNSHCHNQSMHHGTFEDLLAPTPIPLTSASVAGMPYPNGHSTLETTSLQRTAFASSSNIKNPMTSFQLHQQFPPLTSINCVTPPSTFPSPGSAFTELQPRSDTARSNKISTLSDPRGAPGNTPIQEFSVPTSISIKREYNRFLKSSMPSTDPLSIARDSSHCSSQSSNASPVRYDALSSSTSSSTNSATRSAATATTGALLLPYCQSCGQQHNPNSTHRYNYSQAVDADLCCSLCHQPLVEPLDTKCGHTFCTPCLKSHLAVQALCPIDHEIINYLECQQASNIVKRLLDKLLVACPNLRYCETVVYRSRLEDHVRNWCPGTLITCQNAYRGCLFEGPRVTYEQHLRTCPFDAGTVQLPPISNIPSRTDNFVRSEINRPPRSSIASTSMRNGSRAHQSNRTLAHVPSLISSSSKVLPYGADRDPNPSRSDLGFLALPGIDETYDSPIIHEGAPVSIMVHRLPNIDDLGFTFVGGVDTPLSCTLIQQIYVDGAVAVDGRLRPGDQILEVNNQPVTVSTHAEVRTLLSSNITPTIQLTVYREAVDLNTRQNNRLRHFEKEEIFEVQLSKRQSKLLGIKLVGKKNLPGLYVLDLVPGCEAHLDGRLDRNDRILGINGIDLSRGTQEQAARIISTSTDFVTFKVCRRTRSDTPDILRTTNSSSEGKSAHRNHHHSLNSRLRQLQLNSSTTHKELHMRSNSASLTTKLSPSTTQVDVNSVSTEKRWSSTSVSTGSLLSRLNRTSECNPDDPYVVSVSTAELIPADDEDESISESLVHHHTSEDTADIHSSVKASVEKATEADFVSLSTTTSLIPTEERINFGGSHDLDHQSDFSSHLACQERRVQISKKPDEPLGIMVAGGRQSQRGDTSIYITHINDECILGRNKLVNPGDVLLEVNGVGLVGLTHNEAVDVLRRASLGHSQVQLRVINSPETNDRPGNFMPSWTYWLKLPPVCQLSCVIQMVRRSCSGSNICSTSSITQSEPLGFSIIGGLDDQTPTACPGQDDSSDSSNYFADSTTVDESNGCKQLGYAHLYPTPIMIKSIVPGLLAHRDGRLKCGDLILAVNNVSMLNIPHAAAVSLLKRIQDDLSLRIISWPGTIV